MGTYGGPHIIQDGLVLSLDAKSLRSIDESSITWVDLLQTQVTPNNQVVNLDGGLDTWYLKRSIITEIDDGSIKPPFEGAKVWSSTIDSTTYNNNLHRNWTNGSNNGVIGDLGNGYYRYYMWVRGKDSNSTNASLRIDISDGAISPLRYYFGSDDGWKLVQVWDYTTGNYNATKFFDFSPSGVDNDTFYISSINIARYDVPNAASLKPLYSFPGYIPSLETSSIDIQGVLMNGTSYTPYKIEFDGVDDFISLYDSTNLWTDNFSIEFALKLNVTANQFIFSNGTYGSAATNFWFGGGSEYGFKNI